MDYDALEKRLREPPFGTETSERNLMMAAADAIADLRARNEALCAALAKIAPIVVHDGRDYAEVFFSDGRTHSTHAMTMNPQDWMDIQAAYEAAIAANREG